MLQTWANGSAVVSLVGSEEDDIVGGDEESSEGVEIYLCSCKKRSYRIFLEELESSRLIIRGEVSMYGLTDVVTVNLEDVCSIRFVIHRKEE